MEIDKLYEINRVFKAYCTCKNVIHMLDNIPSENLRIAIIDKDDKILDTIEDPGGLLDYYSRRQKTLEKIIEAL